MHVCVCVCACVWRERERKRENDRERERVCVCACLSECTCIAYNNRIIYGKSMLGFDLCVHVCGRIFLVCVCVDMCLYIYVRMCVHMHNLYINICAHI